MANKAVFLDRDGTINVDKGYVHKPGDLELELGAAEGLRALQRDGFGLILVTNQSGIGRGIFTLEDYQNFMEHFYRRLESEGILFKGEYICPHKPEDNCECRKPKTRLIWTAANEHDIDLTKSYTIGDKWADVKMGLDAGCRAAYLLNTGKAGSDIENKVGSARYANSLIEAALGIVFEQHRRQ